MILSAVAALPGHAAQDVPRSPQVVRSGIDLITIDVAALDNRGRPVEDLEARDFAVKVDGRTRAVVSAELVRVDRAPASEAPVIPAQTLVTTNVAPVIGRRVIVAVDQTLILPGGITPLLRTAGRFVNGLTPQDHAAFVAFPEPGPRVDFTRDKARVRDAMQAIIGQPRKGGPKQFSISLTESLAVTDKERVFVDLSGLPVDIWRTLGPTIKRILERGCQGLPIEQLLLNENEELFKECVRGIVQESMVNQLEARTDAVLSLRALEQFLAELVPVEGSKSLVLFSAGVLTENLTVLDEVVRLAAAARTSISVIAVEPDREQEIRSLPNSQPSSSMQDRMQDRSLELQGLETVADRTGGTFVRALAGNGQGIFDQLATELSAWYVVAVERQKGDPDRQRIEVDVNRRGVAVRSTRTFVATAAINAARPAEEVLREAMASPIAISGLPLRVTTFAQRDATTGKYRVHVAAQIGQPGAPAADYAVGYVVMDDRNTVVASAGRRLPLTAAGANQPLRFDTALGIDPGTYSIRFGAVDPEGRRGTVIHRVELGDLTASDLATSDLIVGRVPADSEAMHPDVEPHVDEGRVAAYLELYLPEGDPGGLTVTLEIAEGDASPALTTEQLNMGAGARPEWLVATGAVAVATLPGRYVARATIRRGGETVRVLSRPFILAPVDVDATRPQPVERVRGVAISPEVQRRAASYVSTVVASLSNIVAREEFVLTGPDRRVTSDFLLVRYPGSVQDLLTFRDVAAVNGTALPDRQERLSGLFLQPMSTIRDRVRQISLAAEAHVPPVLNPLYVLAFLQGDFQSRFELTVNDAGPEWPREVKEVTFVETARPTLLRAGPLGDQDVPARGAAWIEVATGRILQTQLQVRLERSPTTVVTKFRVDDRLQIMVPEQMRTENPAGIAAYSNFRRFSVQTDTAALTGPEP
jgi:VWFA-related protein